MSSAVAVDIIVQLSLQVFLLTVAVDALLSYDATMAWISAGFSVLLAAGSAMFYRYLRG